MVESVDRLVSEAGDPPPIPDRADREWPVDPWRRRWLIQTATGRPVNLASLNKALQEACARVGAPVVSSHGLRHTSVSWMIDEGHSADTIAFWSVPAVLAWVKNRRESTVRHIPSSDVRAGPAPGAGDVLLEIPEGAVTAASWACWTCRAGCAATRSPVAGGFAVAVVVVDLGVRDGVEVVVGRPAADAADVQHPRTPRAGLCGVEVLSCRFRAF